MKATNYTDINNLMVVVNFNRETTTEEGEQRFIPAVIEVRADAITEDGAVRSIVETKNVGTLTDEPLTLKQIYTAVNKTTTGALIAGVLKDAVLEAIDSDPSI